MKPGIAASLSGFLGFIDDRVRRDRMLPVAIGRAVRASRDLSPAERRTLGIAPNPSRPVAGALRTGRADISVANAYILQQHRHHGPVAGAIYAVGVYDDHGARGYAIAGRPVSRHLDDGATLEVTRLATDGAANAVSSLYGAVRRLAREQNRTGRNWRRIITYTLAAESGASMRAAGFTAIATSSGGSWSRPTRERHDRHPLGEKVRWESQL